MGDGVKKRGIDSDRLIELYMSDIKYYDICEAFGISLDTLRKRIKEYGLPPRRKPLSIDMEEFREAYAEGLSTYKLAEKFGICRSTVHRFVKRLKLRENEINRAHFPNSAISSSNDSSMSSNFANEQKSTPMKNIPCC